MKNKSPILAKFKKSTIGYFSKEAVHETIFKIGESSRDDGPVKVKIIGLDYQGEDFGYNLVHYTDLIILESISLKQTLKSHLRNEVLIILNDKKLQSINQ